MTILTLDQFNTLFQNADDTIFDAIIEFTDKYNITNLVMFLSQCSVESGYFTIFNENMNYSSHQLLVVWRVILQLKLHHNMLINHKSLPIISMRIEWEMVLFHLETDGIFAAASNSDNW